MTIATETGASPQLSQLISNDEMKQLIREICALDAPPSTRAARLGDKGTFPKLLALDMNAWIYLSRAHYGRAEHPSHVAALESIRRAAAAGGVVGPRETTSTFRGYAKGVMSSAAVRQVVALAAELSEEERRVVIDAIAPQESVAGLAAEWEAEIAQRAERVRTGQSVGKPANEVFDRLEARLKAR